MKKTKRKRVVQGRHLAQSVAWVAYVQKTQSSAQRLRVRLGSDHLLHVTVYSVVLKNLSLKGYEALSLPPYPSIPTRIGTAYP